MPDDADLGGVEYVKYVIETAPWFIDHGLTPNGGGYDTQSRRWTRAMGYYFQEQEYRRFLTLSEAERKEYVSRPEKRVKQAPDAEW